MEMTVDNYDQYLEKTHLQADEEQIVWTTQDGRQLRMHEITDRHLLNIIRYMKRRNFAQIQSDYETLCFLQGEAAIDTAEAEMESNRIEREELIGFFEAEARRRGLQKVGV